MRRRLQRQSAATERHQHQQHRNGHTANGTGRRSELEVVRLKLLGGFRVWVGSRVIEEDSWRLRKARSLTKLLALSPRHRLHREQVMEALWPELGIHNASNNLHQILHTLRRSLEPSASAASSATAACSGYLLLRDDQLLLCPESPLWVDVEAFEEAAVTARHGMEPAAFRAAVDLYAGELLPEDRYEPWVEERRAYLRELYLSLLLELAALYEQRGGVGEAIEALERVVDQVPTHEGAHSGLMRLYALTEQRREALRQYERLREALLREFGAEPEAATVRLHEEIWAGTFAPAHSPLAAGATSEVLPAAGAGGRYNLPLERTSFIGRERETLEVKRLLAMTRLLTLTGVGGSGKTRLALKLASDLAGTYPDGAWLVELAALSERELVPQAVAQALGVREQPGRPLTETLKDALRARQMLLVVDNCEHLIEAVVRLVDALLDSCPGMRVLATSRETLRAAGEVTWVVPSLTVPGSEQAQATERLEGYESVRLFIERARQRDPSFALTPRNGPTVAQVCRRLEGIPLAIELAAARIGVLSVEQLAERLDDSLGLLTAGGRTAEPRQRSLRATLEWSYHLLSEHGQILFRRLSVFAGGWTLEAAEEVCSGEGIEDGDILDLLSELVERSLVVAEAEDEEVVRFRMLEPVRQYAREHLEESGEVESIREWHAHHYLALAETAEPELHGAAQAEWLQRLRIELGNLRGALWWSLEPGDEERERAESGLRLVTALWRFWDVEGFEEGKQWLQTALEKDPGGFPTVRAKALSGLGWILLYQQDYGRAIAALEEAIALYTELGDLSGTGLAVGNLGYAVFHGGYHERLPAFVEEAEALMKRDLDGHTRASLVMPLAAAAMEEGDLESAVSQLEESLALCRELGDLRLTSRTLFTLGMVELERDDLNRGAMHLEEGARITRELGDRHGSFYFAWSLGMVSALRGRPIRAARLWGAAEAVREQMGIMSLSHYEISHTGYEQHLASARSSLDERTWVAAWTEGRAMSSEQAIEYALSTEEPAPPTASQPRMTHADQPTEVLSRREREVAVLIGRGYTNRRIAKELGITERTVETHVSKVLRKLGLGTRTQIAAWAIERRPLLTDSD
jgi:predicted ATPase/DNA-binding SARP family transcriptional activator/DNA-binding CsgD family transcriptional regulator